MSKRTTQQGHWAQTDVFPAMWYFVPMLPPVFGTAFTNRGRAGQVSAEIFDRLPPRHPLFSVKIVSQDKRSLQKERGPGAFYLPDTSKPVNHIL